MQAKKLNRMKKHPIRRKNGPRRCRQCLGGQSSFWGHQGGRWRKGRCCFISFKIGGRVVPRCTSRDVSRPPVTRILLEQALLWLHAGFDTAGEHRLLNQRCLYLSANLYPTPYTVNTYFGSLALTSTLRRIFLMCASIARSYDSNATP